MRGRVSCLGSVKRGSCTRSALFVQCRWGQALRGLTRTVARRQIGRKLERIWNTRPIHPVQMTVVVPKYAYTAGRLPMTPSETVISPFNSKTVCQATTLPQCIRVALLRLVIGLRHRAPRGALPASRARRAGSVMLALICNLSTVSQPLRYLSLLGCNRDALFEPAQHRPD